jgi:predicted metal-dependent hydrolase|tara:strand:- start:2447 stop:3016 length:570 start_codon:yes stop_codon:yes gene_type:complete
MANKSIKITLPIVGEVFLERSTRAKHIRMSIKPPSKIRVAVPVGVSFEEAQKFAEEKEAWLHKQIQKFSISEATSLYEKSDLESKEEQLQKKEAIISRVKYLAREFGFKHNKISTRRMKSRWGSCSYNNSIRINICVSHLPQKLQDYIILHELMHTKIKNHSRHFWSELNNIIDELHEIRKELKYNYYL